MKVCARYCFIPLILIFGIFFFPLGISCAEDSSAAVKIEVEDMVKNLHWLGHDSFRWDGEKVAYFDPWKLSKDAKKADMIFISHEHYDHFSKEDIALLSSADTVIVTTKVVAAEIKKLAIPYRQLEELSPGESIDIGKVKIQGVASYNIGKSYHTKASAKLGFIVTQGGVSIYHAGDTDNIPEMKDYRCDIALLPVSGIYVMTTKEAAQAAIVIKPKLAIPMHYGDIVGSSADANEFQELLKGKVEVKILEKES